MTKNIKTYLIFSVLALLASACRNDIDCPQESGVAGKDVTVRVPFDLPEMKVLTRANLEDYQVNRIDDVWIRTYSASGSGKATMDSWKEIPGESLDPHDRKPVEIQTKSGPTYIVAVANVGNAQGVTKGDLTLQPLEELLKGADTWQEFLDIAVAAPSSDYDINEPPVPLVMAGCLVANGSAHPSIEQWQTAGFTSYDIKATGTGTFTLDGVIHLRRVVSQMTFNLIPGDGISITPNSYRVVNAPKYSWLHERDKARQANFGDAAMSADAAKDYYRTTDIYPGTSFENATLNVDGKQKNIYRFSFWQAENKHDGNADFCEEYNDRQKKTESVGGVTLFTSLTGDAWTPDNMASYVIINCSVDHTGPIKVDGDGNIDKTDGKDAYRSGNASYIIHLGYLDKDATDFNAYRNTKYTYNVHVNGVDQIRVEAFKGDETNGVEGLVTDVENPSYTLDCHYHAYNIELTEDDLTNFGFIISTYDSGVAHTYQDLDFEVNGSYPKEYRQPTEQEKEYIGWVELRPAADAKTLAEYKPAGSDGKTVNLLDITRGLTDGQKSESGWYTVFVNEYTYENDSDESKTNNWQRYVNQPSRRFYIRVTREISNDGNSLYARSKYAGIQRSIQTYYSNRELPAGGIIGAEHENETFGLNVNSTYRYANNMVNGRYNVWLWLNGITSDLQAVPPSGPASRKWEEVIRPGNSQHIFAVNGKQGISIDEHDVTLPSLAYGNSSYAEGGIEDPDALPFGPVNDDDKWIEAVNACMNRNRDNNGNGEIDPEELRWYVPARGKYLRLILGNSSLATPLADYAAVQQLVPGGKGGGKEVALKNCTRLMMFTSERTAVLIFNGASSSPWCGEALSDIASSPWDVRCIRNLGTDLSTVSKEDKTVPAYEHDKEDRTVSMTYFDVNSYRRSENFSGNGTSDGKMPVHIISDERYNRPFAKFEYSPGKYSLRAEGTASRYDGKLVEKNDANPPTNADATSKINNDNPCANLYEGDGWRLPNISELAIMRNLGLFDDFYTGTTDAKQTTYMVSCTKSYYDINGKGYDSEPSTKRNFLGVTYDNTVDIPEITWTGNPYIDYTLYYRCVRDVK